MKRAVIVDAVRTAMGRSKGGFFRNVRADNMSASLIDELFARNPAVKPETVSEVIWGCAQQTLEQGYNVARFISLMTDIPHEAAAQTINRLCGSSLEAINTASRLVMLEEGEVFVVGGVEHMGHVPMDHGVDPNPQHGIHFAPAAMMMGLTAEYLSVSHGVPRSYQDEFAYRSHMLASKADFSNEIIPIMGHLKDGTPLPAKKDEPVRSDTSLESLSSLKPVFYAEGTVTAGNASSIADGAAALIIMEESYAKSLGIKPKARVRGMAVAGVSPSVMGLGPIPAVEKALKRAGLSTRDIDLWELNEAFAVQSLCVIQELGLDLDKVNIKGGAIAMGHPLGASGARISTTLINNMIEKDANIGVATMCVGLGQGIATIYERV